MWVMSQYPDMINEFLQYGKEIPYNIVHLLADLDRKDVTTDIDHGKVTTFIRYKKSNAMNGEGLFVLSFAFETGASLRCVLGLPTLVLMGVTIDLVSDELLCIDLSRKFPLNLKSSVKGLLDGATLNTYSPFIFLVSQLISLLVLLFYIAIPTIVLHTPYEQKILPIMLLL